MLYPGPFHLDPEEQAVVDNIVQGAPFISGGSVSVDAIDQPHQFTVLGDNGNEVHTACRKMTTTCGATLFEEKPVPGSNSTQSTIYVEDTKNPGSYIPLLSSTFDPAANKFCKKNETNSCLLDELKKAARQLLDHQKFKESEFESLARVASEIKIIDAYEKQALRLVGEHKKQMDIKEVLLKMGTDLAKSDDGDSETVLKTVRTQFKEEQTKLLEIKKSKKEVQKLCKKLEPEKQSLIKTGSKIMKKANARVEKEQKELDARIEKRQKELDVAAEVDDRNQLEYPGT